MEIEESIDLDKKSFGTDFKWGISVAAYQIEGGHDADGKGQSIWDIFSNTKGKTHQGQHANISADFYTRYKEDIDLIKKLNIPNFRFSISWSRILPSGEKTVNQAGIDFYNKIINYCLELNIQPWITLYHWDLPQALELKGGWTNRKIVTWFSEYVEICANHFGDRVKHWMVMNEPAVFVGAGYFLGIHAPGKRGMKNFLPAIHHTVLSMAEGGRMLRKILPEAEIGTTFSCSHIEPFSTKKRDVLAANRVDAVINRLFIEPVLGLGYPLRDIPALSGIQKYILKGDEEKMHFDFDFTGLQNYTREIVKSSFLTPYIWAKLVKAETRKVNITLMKWEIYPPAIYEIIKKYNAYPQIKKIYITENGAAFPDTLQDGKIDDTLRTQYIQNHLAQVLKAKKDGFQVDGYFVWTLTDNFEWAEGYHPRFGLVYVDFETQKRTVKASGYWYGGFLGETCAQYSEGA